MPNEPRIPTIVVTLKMRSDTPANWSLNNPKLEMGEFGLEQGTNLLKIGNGSAHWNALPYLNKIDSNYFTVDDNKAITLNTSSILQNVITTAGGQIINGTLRITATPSNEQDVVNKSYVDALVASAGGAGSLSYRIVTTLPPVNEGNINVIYLVKAANAQNADNYKEYMLIDDGYERAFIQIGDTSINLQGLISGSNTTAGNLLKVGVNGEIVDAGISASDIGALEPGTSDTLGGVKSSTQANFIRITNETEDGVGNDGFMVLNRVSTSLLYVPPEDGLIIDGGSSVGGVVSNG